MRNSHPPSLVDFGFRISDFPPTQPQDSLTDHSYVADSDFSLLSPEDTRVGRRLPNGAPEARQMFSLGREPQVQDDKKKKSPGGATDYWLRREPQSSPPDICRRSAADVSGGPGILGLTPQAIHISPLRGSMHSSLQVAFRIFLLRVS
jgi:hypothetical protein